MTAFKRTLVLLLATGLSACSMTNERNYSACVVGVSTAGGIAGGGTGGGSLIGFAVGAGVGMLACRGDEEREEVAVAAYEAPPMSDSDGDGVPDDRDRCPNTPAGVAVDADGCPLDSDGDGVANYADQSPNTPEGVAVDAMGVPLANEVFMTLDSYSLAFAFDSAELNDDARAALDSAFTVVRDNSDVQLDLVGHTDSMGTDAYNQGLSERRAQAAVDYLVSKGVAEGQLRAVGRGEAEPVASNATEDGRARNRRVEFVVR